MKKLSVGNLDSTLDNWHMLSKAMFGPESQATKFLQEKIDKQGPDEEVIVAEDQLLIALTQIHLGMEEPGDDPITEG